MRLKLVSVPFSGTRFLRKILEENGRTPDEEIHTFVQAMWPQWFQEGPVICPIRDPMLHAIGIINRGKDHSLNMRLQDFDVLASLATDQTHFFPIDTHDREGETKKLATFLGLGTVTIDWTPVGTIEDRTGLRAKYMADGIAPKAWTDQVGWPARQLLRSLGYSHLKWLDA